MQNHLLTWRGMATSVMAIVVYVLLTAAGADAQVSISKTDIDVENTGAGDANTGRNAVSGNESLNVTGNVQETEADDDADVEHNSLEETNESEGESSVETGSAIAVGNVAATAAVQASATTSAVDALIEAAVGTPSIAAPIPPLLASEEAPVDADASAPEESTESEADLETDDESEEPETTGEDESAAAAAEEPAPSGGSIAPATTLPRSGSSAADAGTPAVPALAFGPLDNTVLGAVSGAGPPGLNETDQTIDVENLGEARANTGENAVVDGDVLTGNAKAIGSMSATLTSQTALAPGDLGFVDQDADVDNEGEAAANTGVNAVEGGALETGDAEALGNDSETESSQFALTTGDVNDVDQDVDVDNEGEADANTGVNAVEDGDVSTGNATATGNRAVTETSQSAVATGDVIIVDQATDVDNEGDAIADTGTNAVIGGALETGDADAAGSISATSALQLTVADGDQTLVDQAITASNEGDALAETGENTVEDGEVATGDATATGNWSGTALGQRATVSDQQSDIEQALEAENVGNAHADTGENLAVAGEDGEAVILTGDALAIGNRAAVAASQDV
jgi:hypothetical protein